MSGNINITAVDPAVVDVVTIQLPGAPGPRGVQGVPGPSNILTIGTVSTGAPGSTAVATISGVSPAQTLNLTIPQGPVGATGPANTIAIGTVNTIDATTGASATITGTAPNQTLNLVIPRGYGVIPAGTTGAVLTKLSNTDYDTAWAQPASAATASALVIRDASGNAHFGRAYADTATPTSTNELTRKDYVDGQDATYRRRTVNSAATSPSYTLALSDEGKAVYNTSAALAVTVPNNTTVAFPVGSWVDVVAGSSATTTIIADTGVTLIGPDGQNGGTFTVRSPYSTVRLYKYGSNNWFVTGDAANVVSNAVAAATNAATANAIMKRDASAGVNANQFNINNTVPVNANEATRKDYVDAGTLNAAQHPSAVWYSASTSNTANGQWWKIGTVTATAQYMDATVGLLVTSSGTGGGNQQQARVVFRVKQQNAMASAPYVSVVVQNIIVDSTAYWTAANFVAITETNTAGSTVVSLWVTNNQLYSNLYAYEEFQRVSTAMGTFAYAASGAAGTVTGSLPAGPQAPGAAPLVGDTVALTTQSSVQANPPAGTGKLYLDSTNRAVILGSSGSTRTAQYSWGAGTAFPAIANMAGDTFLRTDIGTNGTVFQYTGNTSAGSAGWIAEGPVVCTSTTHPTAALYAGLQLFDTDTEMQWTYNGTVWHLTGGRTPSCHVFRKAASAAFAYGARTACTFDTVWWQDGGTWWNATNPTRITAPVSGMYQVSGTIVFPQMASRYGALAIRVNGGTGIYSGTSENWFRGATCVGNSVFYSEMTVSNLLLLNAGDYVEMMGELDGTTSTNIAPVISQVGTASSSMRIEAQFVRPLVS